MFATNSVSDGVTETFGTYEHQTAVMAPVLGVYERVLLSDLQLSVLAPLVSGRPEHRGSILVNDSDRWHFTCLEM